MYTVQVIITFSSVILLTALDDQPYSPERKKEFLNEYFYRLEEELWSFPKYYMLLELRNAFIIVEKP